MAQGTCSIEGCERPHWAKGYCHPHYSADRRKRLGRESLHLRTCVVCGTDWQTTRKDAKLCSDQCRSVCYSQPRVKCPLPSNHPVMLEIQRLRAEAKRQREAASRSDYAWRTARECRGCGCMFTPLYTSTMLDCSRRCQGRVHRRRRRAAEHGAVGTFIWSDFMRIAQRFGFACAYCGQRAGQLDPDHVIPLSRGGYNSVANLLPSCRPCNADKRDLLLDEWATDRERRGLPPRATAWPSEDKRYWHLTQAALLAAA